MLPYCQGTPKEADNKRLVIGTSIKPDEKKMVFAKVNFADPEDNDVSPASTKTVSRSCQTLWPVTTCSTRIGTHFLLL